MSLPKETMEILEALAPELQVSEDERIRKALVWHLKADVDFVSNGVTKAECLAYLEKQKELTTEDIYNAAHECIYGEKKQKEQKPIVLSDKFEIALEEFLMNARDVSEKTFVEDVKEYADRLREIVINEKKKQKPAEWSEKHIADIFEKVGLAKIVREQGNDALTNAVQSAMIELSKTENVEWSEEDSDNLERVDNYLWMLDDYVGDDCAMPQGKTDKIRGNIQGILSPWLKSLPERFNLQSKQEWSEEDEKHINNILDIIDYWKATMHFVSYQGCTIDADINWLKSLKPQYHGDVTMTEAYKMGKEAGEASHWKPSKNEIDAFENLLKGEFPNKIFPGTTLTNLLTKLKKLYYNEAIPSAWKPSEEQIYSLGTVVKGSGDCAVGSVGYNLNSLYEDLKKL